jgi:c-di-GMP-binding flagellar brake protein YcgR
MNDDRRRYFRLNDTLALAYRVLTPESEAPSLEDPLQAQIQTCMAQLAHTQPALVELLELLDQKWTRALQLRDPVAQPLKTHSVNISACGLAFVHQQALPVGTQLRLDIQLLPDTAPLQAQASVLACDPCLGGYCWRLVYTCISHEASERLIQHLLKRQREQIQATRATPAADKSS